MKMKKLFIVIFAAFTLGACSTIGNILGTEQIENVLPSEELKLKIIASSLIVKAAASNTAEALEDGTLTTEQAQTSLTIIKEAEEAVKLANSAYQNGVGDGAPIYDQMQVSINLVLGLIEERL